MEKQANAIHHLNFKLLAFRKNNFLRSRSPSQFRAFRFTVFLQFDSTPGRLKQQIFCFDIPRTRKPKNIFCRLNLFEA